MSAYIKNSVLGYIGFIGHVQGMDDEGLPRKILECCLPGRRRKGRPSRCTNCTNLTCQE